MQKKIHTQQEFLKSKNDIHKTWDTIKSVLNNSTHSDRSVISIKSTSNTILHNAKEIVDEFNSFFINIGCKSSVTDATHRPNFNSYLKYHVTSSFHFHSVTEEEIKTIIRNPKK